MPAPGGQGSSQPHVPNEQTKLRAKQLHGQHFLGGPEGGDQLPAGRDAQRSAGVTQTRGTLGWLDNLSLSFRPYKVGTTNAPHLPVLLWEKKEKAPPIQHMAWGLARSAKVTVPNLFIAIASPAVTTSGKLLTLFLLVEKL